MGTLKHGVVMGTPSPPQKKKGIVMGTPKDAIVKGTSKHGMVKGTPKEAKGYPKRKNS